MDPAIEVQHLHVSYYGKEVIHDISFSIDRGRLVGIIGPNGAGKSTLIKAILGLIPKDQGNVKAFGKPMKEVRKKIAYVPQRSQIDWDFPITVRDTVLLGTFPRLGLFRRPKKADRQWAEQCLAKVDMKEFSKRQIGELSGGQQQRVFLARALAQRAELFFLDEPFVGIDVASEKTIIDILKQLRDDGKTVFVVHHDLAKIEDYFDELILLNKKLIQSGPVEDVFQQEFMMEAYQSDFPFMNKVEVGV
ncbi:MAG TPA: metal ABC transporter ATP-binding protein [Bacillota bacterium]|nr:metal ABC transporter ATP-binding protein [Bacillota bacterium]